MVAGADDVGGEAAVLYRQNGMVADQVSSCQTELVLDLAFHRQDPRRFHRPSGVVVVEARRQDSKLASFCRFVC